ncbi:MAG: hypothetical protein AB7G39_15175 [Alphaproteobacteria bacterium]
MRIVRLALVLGIVLAALPASAQQTDPADLAFWQAIQNSTNPAEYQAYLQSFPNGRFAGLAQLRAQGRGLPANAAPAAPAGIPAMPAGPMPGMPAGAMPGMAAGPSIPQDTERPHPNAARFQFTMEQAVINLGENPVVKVANVPPKVKMSVIIVRAGTKMKGWRDNSPDAVGRYNFDYYNHDPDPSGPNQYLDTATLEYRPLPVGDYWIRYYTTLLTGADALAGTVAFRVQ